MPAIRRLNALTGVVTLAAVMTGGVTAPSASAGKPPAVRPTQELAMLLKAHTVVSAPHARPSRVGRVRAWRPITGARTVLPVIGRTTTMGGVHWLRVRVPGRPNGMKGWIVQRATVLTKTRWRVIVRTSSRRVRVYRRGRLVRTFAAIVGKPETPTPHGQFFVE